MTEWDEKNLLCFGDNLTFLSDSTLFPDESIDLIYLDPPFNSQATYNILFKETTGTPDAAQIKAFEDTWTWDQSANEALTRIHTDRKVPAPLVELMKTFMNFLKPSPMMAYLVQMAIRLVHMHRILKPTGSLYLHCDPTASHYLKLVLDAIFGPRNFRREIIWSLETVSGYKSTARNWIRCHDTLFYYAKDSSKVLFNIMYLPHRSEYVARFKKTDSKGRKYRDDRSGGRRQYLDETPGRRIGDVWDDIMSFQQASTSSEYLGYQTQKPLALLKRIVSASSNPGDVILDPFCGCGTTIDAVETINRENPEQEPRRWIGIDITHLAINLIKHRLTRFSPPPEYKVIGEPESLSGAKALARQDPFQFQFWALGLIGARPTGSQRKKGADMGIDGVRYIMDEQKNGHWVTKRMLVQVKSGKVGVKDIRDFVGTLTREKAEMGVFITLAEPTARMKQEAASVGNYTSPWDNKPYPKVQILTIEQLLQDPHRPNPRCLQIPGGTSTQHTLPNPPKHKQSAKGKGKLLLF